MGWLSVMQESMRKSFFVCPGGVELYCKYCSLHGRALGISLRDKESEDSTVNSLYQSWLWLWLLHSGCQWPLVGFAQLFVIPALPLTAGVTAEAVALLSCEVSAAFTWTCERISISFVQVSVSRQRLRSGAVLVTRLGCALWGDGARGWCWRGRVQCQ